MIQTGIPTAEISSTDDAMLVPTGIMSVQMEDAFQSMLFVKTTMRWEPAHLVTGALHCQVATASQQLKTILTAKAETP